MVKHNFYVGSAIEGVGQKTTQLLLESKDNDIYLYELFELFVISFGNRKFFLHFLAYESFLIVNISYKL
jgi:hypothetical protein